MMPKPYSGDFRSHVIGEVVGGASRREVAERFGISPSVVIIWAQRYEETGSVVAKPSGGSTSPLEEHEKFLMDLLADKPDITLDEVVASMKKQKIPGSRTSVWRFYDRRDISFKKNSIRLGTKAQGRRPRASALDARARSV
jgi:transposase